MAKVRRHSWLSFDQKIMAGVRNERFLGKDAAVCLTLSMNYRTKAEYFIRGITQGVIDASEVIAWADEVIVSAPKSEEWMVEISSSGPDDRLAILGHLNTIKGDVDKDELQALLKARGLTS